MKLQSTITIWIVLALLTTSSCKKDPLIEPINPLTTIVSSGNIHKLGISDMQLVYSSSPEALVVMDRRDGSEKHYHKFNSQVFDIFKIQAQPTGRVCIGDSRGGLYYYANDIVQFIIKDEGLVGFDYQRQHCNQVATRIRFNNQKGIEQQISTLNFSFGTNAQTAMVAFNDTVWVGTKQQGLFFISVNDPTPRSISKEFQGNYENVQLVVDSNDNLWSLTTKYLNIRKNGNWTIRRLPSAMLATDMVVIDDAAYIASDRGLFKYSNDQFVELTQVNVNLRHKFVTCLAKEENHTLWLGTGAGIYSYPLK